MKYLYIYSIFLKRSYLYEDKDDFFNAKYRKWDEMIERNGYINIVKNGDK